MIIPGITEPDLPFNRVIRAGRFLFLTSQLSSDLKTGEIKSGTIVEQTRQSLDNIKFLLEGCGATMDDIVKTVIYVFDCADLITGEVASLKKQVTGGWFLTRGSGTVSPEGEVWGFIFPTQEKRKISSDLL